MQPQLKPDNMPLPQRLTPHSLFSSTTRDSLGVTAQDVIVEKNLKKSLELSRVFQIAFRYS
jgi:hypothetical protein